MHTLRMLFELRKTIALNPRKVTARCFVAFGKYGFVDDSGILWPIYFRSNIVPPKHGSYVSFESTSFRPDGAAATKYEDAGYFLVVDRMTEVIASDGEWQGGADSNPLPPEQMFASSLQLNHTEYFERSSAQRCSNLKAREIGLDRVRRYFKSHGFLEAETPVLVPSGGIEVYLKMFETSYQDYRRKIHTLQLPTSPEIALKKLLAEGHALIFQVAHSFRNEGQLTSWHEPDFLMLEWYRIGAGCKDIMRDTAQLVHVLAESLGSRLSLPEEWPTFTVTDLFQEHLSIDLLQCQDVNFFREQAAPLSPSVLETDDWDSVFCKLFMEKIEPQLAKHVACFVTNYPKQMGALARCSKQPEFVERFEGYLCGIEICNGYDELCDVKEYFSRVNETTKSRSDIRLDPVFDKTMRFGLPPSGGNALGLDRVLALLLGLQGIAPLYPIPFLNQFEEGTVANE